MTCVSKDKPRIHILYSETAIVPTGSDYLVDLIAKHLYVKSLGVGTATVNKEDMDFWMGSYVDYGMDSDASYKTEYTEEQKRLYEYLTKVSNKLKDDGKKPDTIKFTS